MMRPLRTVFMGTPEFAVPTLTEIVSTGHEVVAVYTRAPKPAGRGQAERKSPVHEAAEGFGIPVFTPRSLKQAPEQEAFASLDADVAVVVAYGLILPKPILEAPRLGCLNRCSESHVRPISTIMPPSERKPSQGWSRKIAKR